MAVEMQDLEKAAERFNLLRHSFYQRWVAGELTRHELNDYAGQYAHVVAGLPRWLEAAAAGDAGNRDRLRDHAAEEATHVALWERFTLAVDPDREVVVDAPNRATAELIRRCDELADRGHGAAVAWSIEAQSPAVSATKLEGLETHYGIGASDGGEYFALHAHRDVDHAAELEEVIAGSNQVGAAAAVEAALSGMWDLLTSVERPAKTV